MISRQGTSSRSTKLIHGGLWYLKQLGFKLVAEAVRERQLLLRMAPHLVEPLPFLFPVYRGDPDSLLALRAGLLAYDLFSRFEAHHRVLDVSAVLAREPDVRRADLVGGALYTDSRTDDARLTLAVLQSAHDHGATVANYIGVDAFVHRVDGPVSGVRVRDALSRESFEVRTRHIIAAVGPWADALRRVDDASAPSILRVTRGIHVSVPATRLAVHQAVVIRSYDRERRMMFAIPRGAYTYLGTTDTDFEGSPEYLRVDREEVRYVLEAANAAFPSARLTEEDVASTWAGLRPLV